MFSQLAGDTMTPFVLYVLTNDALDNHLSGSFSDIIYGLDRYKDIALSKFGIEVRLAKNKTSSQLVASGERFDGVFSCWDSAISHRDKAYKQRAYKTSSFIDDFHWWNKDQLAARLEFFDKIDVVFSPYYRTLTTCDLYKNTYREFQHKFTPLYWWSNDVCYVFDIKWKDRKDRILLSGAVGPWYKLRQAIAWSRNPLIEHLKHCGYDNFSHPYHGDNFLRYMATFKGAVGTSASPMPTQYDASIVHPLDYTLKKPFETLGCGTLGFLEKTADFDELGLIPYVHYVPITAGDFDKWDLIFRPEAEAIANAGREFVKQNHSTKNRVLTILQTLKDRWL